MKDFYKALTVSILSLIIGLSSAAILPARAQDDEAVPEEFKNLTGEQILELVRLSQALLNHDLSARLRNGKDYTPLGISMRKGSIYFKFRDPDEIIQLEMAEEGSILHRQTREGSAAIPAADYGKIIRGTDVTYEDLSMRFLYWPKPVMLKEERVGFKKCWKLRVVNPNRTGPYQSVLIWVHQASGALIKMEGYGWKPSENPVKKFLVTKVQKIDGVWILKQMQVETIDPGNGKSLGDTYLEVRKPEPAK
ncbi:MAG: outer membrane lipoprotein-sorting protein [Verrucomicrobiae bacterium]|nr:outer membrane lipoprotein-sorting protein [Verrucomicrobiae bacterium]